MDEALIHSVIQLRRPWLDDVMIVASALGAGSFIWIVISITAGIFPRYTAGMVRLWLAVGVSFLVMDDVLKPLVARARPFEVIPEIRLIDARPTSPSFPSGHATSAVAGALAASRMMPAGAWIFWPLAAVIAVSRVYLGVHWPSDILAGALLGWGVAWFILGPRISPGPQKAQRE